MTPALTPVLAAALLLAGCGSAGGDGTTVTVLAAASLSRAFPAVGAAFERAHPGVRVQLSFAGSQTLVAQVRQGVPASVLATADLTTLQSVADELRGPPVVFAHNQLALVTAPGNPLGLRSLADLDRPRLKVVLAAPAVPAGRAAASALTEAHVSVDPVSWEDAVTGVVTKVRLGEADAGLAYATDLDGPGGRSDGDHPGRGLGGVALPGTATSLAIAAVDGAQEADVADLFIAFVQGDVGQQILRSYGFR